jgi:hypothetical protein
VEEGVVVIHDWPTPSSVERGTPWGVIDALDDCLERHRHDSRWIAMCLDIDEFLFSPTGKPLPEALAEYEPWRGVCVVHYDFGSSGHERKPPGLVIENYFHRKSYPPGAQEWVKSIVDPQRTVRCFNAHWFAYESAFLPVDENKQIVDGWLPPSPRGREQRGIHRNPSASLLRINHYLTKSEEEFRTKLTKWKQGGWPRDDPGPAWRADFYSEFDDTITAFVPALREALERAPR